MNPTAKAPKDFNHPWDQFWLNPEKNRPQILQIAREAQKHLLKIEFDTVVGVQRKGVPLARIFSELMGKQFLEILKIEFDGEKSHALPPSSNVSGKKLLIVDDVYDKGTSAKVVASLLVNAGAVIAGFVFVQGSGTATQALAMYSSNVIILSHGCGCPSVEALANSIRALRQPS